MARKDQMLQRLRAYVNYLRFRYSTHRWQRYFQCRHIQFFAWPKISIVFLMHIKMKMMKSLMANLFSLLVGYVDGDHVDSLQ